MGGGTSSFKVGLVNSMNLAFVSVFIPITRYNFELKEVLASVFFNLTQNKRKEDA